MTNSNPKENGERKEKFTPGPWRWTMNILEQGWGDHDNVLYAEAEPLDDYGSWHARLVFEGNEDADRALIAAAPDLYEIVRRACACDAFQGEHLFQAAVAAIAKANGEPLGSSTQEDGNE